MNCEHCNQELTEGSCTNVLCPSNPPQVRRKHDELKTDIGVNEFYCIKDTKDGILMPEAGIWSTDPRDKISKAIRDALIKRAEGVWAVVKVKLTEI